MHRNRLSPLQRLATLLLSFRTGAAWLVVPCFAALACYAVPRGIEAYHLVSIADDPAAIADRALSERFDADAARAGIEDALAAKDPDLAQSFLALADERHVVVDPTIATKVEAAVEDASSVRRKAQSFARGFVTGEPDDGASLAGTIGGDLFVFGDIRDAAREGGRLAMGKEADQLVLGLACVGLAITAATYATVGVGAPLRAGLTLVKAARKAGRLSAGLGARTGRLLRSAVDLAQVKRAAASMSAAHPAVAVRAARDAVKLERAGKIVELARDLRRVQAKAGTRGALDALQLAQTPREVGRVAKLTEKHGLRTRAILKVLGRGAIMLTVGSVNLVLWMLGAAFSLLSFVWSLKRGVERMAERYLRRRTKRRLRAIDSAVGLRVPQPQTI